MKYVRFLEHRFLYELQVLMKSQEEEANIKMKMMVEVKQ